MSQNFYYYPGMNGTNGNSDAQASGAYIFRPNGTTHIPIATKAEYSVHKGTYVKEMKEFGGSECAEGVTQ